MSGIAKNSAIVTVFNVVGTSLIILSNSIVAYKFGAGANMDVYFASTSIPFFVTLIMSMTLSFTFIPIFTSYEKNHTEERWKIVSSFINASIIIMILVCVAGIFFAHEIMRLITPGFTAEKIKDAAFLMQLLFPVIIISGINELLSSVYYSHNRFITPSLNKIINPVMTISFVMLLGGVLSTKSLIFAILIAYVIQGALLITGFLRHKDFEYSFCLNFKHPEVIRIFKLVSPLMAAMIITKSTPIVDRFFLSETAEGSISYVSYAYRITLRIVDAVASGLIIAIFPAIAKNAAMFEYDKMYDRLIKGSKMLIFLTIPFITLLIFYGEPLIRFIFEHGEFTSRDTSATFAAFRLYLLAVPAVMIAGIFYKGFYSLQKHTLIAQLSVAVMVLYIFLCYMLLNIFGYLAIPLSFVISFNLALLASGLLIKRHLKPLQHTGAAKEFLKILVSGLVTAVILLPIMGHLQTMPVFYCFFLALGLIFYYAISKYLFKVESANVIWKFLFRK